MSLLDTFLLAFKSDGLETISGDVKETEKDINSLEKCETKLNETLDETNKKAKDAKENLEDINNNIPKLIESLDIVKNGLEQIVKTYMRIETGANISAVLGIGAAGAEAVLFANNVSAISKEAENAKKSLEDLQNEEFGRQIYTREDVNNAKEYEQVMRDIRAGQTSISANIGRLFLPALIQVTKIVRAFTNFWADHYPLINMGIIAIAGAIGTVLIGLRILKGFLLGPLYKAIWKVILTVITNPIGIAITAIIATIASLMLVLDDLYAWFTGGESALGGFWDKVFGGVEGAKDLVDDFRKAWEMILPAIKWVGDAIMWVVKGALKLFVGALILIPTLIVTIISKVLQLIAWLGKIPEKIKTILHIGTENSDSKPDGKHKSGLDYVPFDGYIAELHKGERVQTADEANDWRSGLMAAKKAINFTASYPLNAIPAGAVSNAYNNSSTNRTINIGDITIQTQATDAQGIATDIASYIKQAVISLDDGMLA